MKLIHQKDILLRQDKMGMGVLVTTIIVMMTIQWMTLDMYLPALPVLKDEFHTSEAALNVSLNTDMFFFAVGMLVGGTISDKYGRKSIMLLGLILSALAMFLCAFSNDVVFLSAVRGLCGLGGGFALAVASAVIRDSFEGNTFQNITTVTQASAVIGPIFAPAIGSFLIEYLSWRWIFITLGIGTVVTLIPFLFFTETWPRQRRHVSSVWQATLQSFDLAKNGEYMLFMTMIALLTLPTWAYLATCSYIYYDDFHVSNLEYSVFYAIGSLASFIAPFIYIWIDRRSSTRRVVDLSFIFLMISIALFITLAGHSPVMFLLASIPILMAEAVIRSLSMVVVLDKYPEQAGSVSSLTGFLLSIISVVSTTIATLQWSSFLFGIAVITAACTGLSLLLWYFILRRKVYADQLGLK